MLCMPRAVAGMDDLNKCANRVAAVVASCDVNAVVRVQDELRRLSKGLESGSYDRGLCDGLLQVLRAAAFSRHRSALAGESAALERGSLPARMLLEVAAGVRGANADLADRLGTDAWQVSRAGRRLRELGLATRSRSGRLNEWRLTPAGEGLAIRLRCK